MSPFDGIFLRDDIGILFCFENIGRFVWELRICQKRTENVGVHYRRIIITSAVLLYDQDGYGSRK